MSRRGARPSADVATTGDLRRTTAGMAAGTVASRVTGFGRVLALAYAVDYGRLTDTYNLANTTPNIVYELVLGGVLSASLVPLFIDRLATRDEDEAGRAVSAVVTVSVVALATLTAVFLLAAPAVIRLFTLRLSGEAAEDQQRVATHLLRMFAPQVFFYGLITVTSALLNARRRFFAPMATPVLNNLVVIAVLLALPHVADDLTLDGIGDDQAALLLLGLGTTAGVVVQALVLLPALRGTGLAFRPRWEPNHEAVRTLLRLAGWTVGVVITNQLALWVVLFLANDSPADVSAYQAAYQFFLLPHAVVAVSLMTALLPDLSERWAVGDRDGFGARLTFGLRTTAAVLVPAAAGYAVLARPLVSLLLEHGALSERSALAVADTLRLFALGLPLFSAYLLLMRAYQAMQDTRSMFAVYCVENGLNVVLAFLLYPALGVEGLALAFALAYGGGTAVALWDVRRRLGGLDLSPVAGSLARVCGAAGIMAAGVALVAAVVGGDEGPALLLRVTAAVGAGVTLFGLGAKALGVREVGALLKRRGAV